MLTREAGWSRVLRVYSGYGMLLFLDSGLWFMTIEGFIVREVE